MNTSTRGWLNGLIGVVIFAGSMPATRVAVADIPPLFLTGIRGCIAAALALVLLAAFKQPRPQRADIQSLLIIALGVVLGFPLLTALALQHISSAHSLVFIGLLPLCTAIFGVLRGGEQPHPAFWLFSLLGSASVISYAALGGIAMSVEGDLLMLAAVLVCGLGYAEGAKLSRRLGGWQVISWALVIALPLMLPLTLLYWPDNLATVSSSAWIGLGYVSVFSMLVGFIFWYNGLAQGGIAAVGQLQLLQPFMGLGLAALLLHEQVNTAMILATCGAVVCVALAKRYA